MASLAVIAAVGVEGAAVGVAAVRQFVTFW